MNRAPNTSWSLRRPGTYPNGYVLTVENDAIRVIYCKGDNGIPSTLTLSRREARLLAKRINQCLDETRR